MPNRSTVYQMLFIALCVAICIFAFSGSLVQIGGAVTQVSLLDISLIALKEPSFTDAYKKVATLANFSLLEQGAAVVFFSALLIAAAKLSYVRANPQTAGVADQETTPSFQLANVRNILVVFYLIALIPSLIGAKMGVNYDELYRVADLKGSTGSEVLRLLGPPKLGEKSGY